MPGRRKRTDPSLRLSASIARERRTRRPATLKVYVIYMLLMLSIRPEDPPLRTTYLDRLQKRVSAHTRDLPPRDEQFISDFQNFCISLKDRRFHPCHIPPLTATATTPYLLSTPPSQPPESSPTTHTPLLPQRALEVSPDGKTGDSDEVCTPHGPVIYAAPDFAPQPLIACNELDNTLKPLRYIGGRGGPCLEAQGAPRGRPGESSFQTESNKVWKADTWSRRPRGSTELEPSFMIIIINFSSTQHRNDVGFPASRPPFRGMIGSTTSSCRTYHPSEWWRRVARETSQGDAVDIIYYNMIISYIQYITSHHNISHHKHTPQKQVRRPLILLLHVLRGDHGYLVGSHLTYANTTTEIYELLFNLIQGPPYKSDSTKLRGGGGGARGPHYPPWHALLPSGLPGPPLVGILGPQVSFWSKKISKNLHMLNQIILQLHVSFPITHVLMKLDELFKHCRFSMFRRNILTLKLKPLIRQTAVVQAYVMRPRRCKIRLKIDRKWVVMTKTGRRLLRWALGPSFYPAETQRSPRSVSATSTRYLLSASACVSLSLVRLIHQHYGGTEDARTNRAAALNIFYGLALAEALLFLIEKALREWKKYFTKVNHMRLAAASVAIATKSMLEKKAMLVDSHEYRQSPGEHAHEVVFLRPSNLTHHPHGHLAAKEAFPNHRQVWETIDATLHRYTGEKMMCTPWRFELTLLFRQFRLLVLSFFPWSHAALVGLPHLGDKWLSESVPSRAPPLEDPLRLLASYLGSRVVEMFAGRCRLSVDADFVDLPPIECRLLASSTHQVSGSIAFLYSKLEDSHPLIGRSRSSLQTLARSIASRCASCCSATCTEEKSFSLPPHPFFTGILNHLGLAPPFSSQCHSSSSLPCRGQRGERTSPTVGRRRRSPKKRRGKMRSRARHTPPLEPRTKRRHEPVAPAPPRGLESAPAASCGSGASPAAPWFESARAQRGPGLSVEHHGEVFHGDVVVPSSDLDCHSVVVQPRFWLGFSCKLADPRRQSEVGRDVSRKYGSTETLRTRDDGPASTRTVHIVNIAVGPAPVDPPLGDMASCVGPWIVMGLGSSIFHIFQEKFPKSFLPFQELLFLHRNNTMVVLLKTTSVRVSFIQTRVQNKRKSVMKNIVRLLLPLATYTPAATHSAPRVPPLSVSKLVSFFSLRAFLEEIMRVTTSCFVSNQKVKAFSLCGEE
ncbi:hypothetical protein ZWY2020_057391 [Hordeum vulgare]|nr:hypothetical protein ZWY2020_057391 [Hordeum vulgare]